MVGGVVDDLAQPAVVVEEHQRGHVHLVFFVLAEVLDVLADGRLEEHQQQALIPGRFHAAYRRLDAAQHVPRTDLQPGPAVTDVSRKSEEQNDTALEQVAVVVLHRAPRGVHVDGFGARRFPGKLANRVRPHARDLLGFLRRIVGKPLLEELEHGTYAHFGAIGQRHLEATLERRIELAERQGRAPPQALAPGRSNRLTGLRVPQVKHVVLAALFHVGSPQELPRVVANEDRQVGLFFDVVGLVQPFIDDDLGHAEGQGGIGTDAQVDPLVRVHRRGVVIGSDAHDLRAPVTGFPEEMGLGNAGIGRVSEPHEDQIGADVVVGSAVRVEQAPRQDDTEGHVADGRPAVELGGTEVVEERHLAGRGRSVPGVGRSTLVNDAFGTVFTDHLEHLVRDFLICLVPGDPLPLARTARPHSFDRILQPVRSVHQLTEARPFLATARVVVGKVGRARVEDSVLFLAPNDAVLDVQHPRTCGSAVGDVVRGVDDLIPRPFLPINVLPIPVALLA